MISSINKNIKLEQSWKSLLEAELTKTYILELFAFLQTEIENKIIYPSIDNYFAAFNLTPFHKVKVVLLGQDPYHGPGQAHGLCFSVGTNVKLPPSLKNIFKELHTDLNLPIPQLGNLTPWAQQGVLMLNNVLTVEDGKAGSHQGQGWETLTDKVIELLSHESQNLIYVLWGSHAQKKGALIDRTKNLVIEAPHPSPLSSYRGFFGSKPFSKINKYLLKTNQSPIDWNLVE